MSLDPEIVKGNNTMGAEHGIPNGERNELVVQAEPQLPALPQEMSIEQVAARVQKVRELQQKLMKVDIHYGVIPGTERQDNQGNDISKKTLLKPGAELLCLTFMLDPQYENEIKQIGEHREITCTCRLYHIPTGRRVSSGVGSCSTYESKYAYRKAVPTCPNCQKELRRSKNKEEWYCWQKMGGCGATYPLKDSRIKPAGRIPNPDLADQYNTVLKMASKRALVDAVLKATAASESYTQDLEDFVEDDGSSVADTTKQDASAGQAAATSDDRAESSATDNKSGSVRAVPRPDSGEPQRKNETGNRPPVNEPTGQDQPTPPLRAVNSGPKPISVGQANLLKQVFRTAKADEVTAIQWLAEYLSIEIEFDDQKTPAENLDAMLRKVPGEKVGDVKNWIQAKAKEGSDG